MVVTVLFGLSFCFAAVAAEIRVSVVAIPMVVLGFGLSYYFAAVEAALDKSVTVATPAAKSTLGLPRKRGSFDCRKSRVFLY